MVSLAASRPCHAEAPETCSPQHSCSAIVLKPDRIGHVTDARRHRRRRTGEKVATMAADKDLSQAHGELVKRFNALEQSGDAARPETVEAVAAQLAELKVLLSLRDLLYPQLLTQDGSQSNIDNLVLARGVLEIGVLLSIRMKDTDSFDRYWSQLKTFYVDYACVGTLLSSALTSRDQLPPSENFEPILGMWLLRLLSSNAIAAFHIALETLPADLVRDSEYIQHPVLLERWLMEGSYSNVWRERKNVPRQEYRFFVDMLVITIRHEIASCEEKAYDTLPLNDVATLLFFDSLPEVLEFANERGWHVNPTSQTVEFANKRVAERSADGQDAEQSIPMRSTIASNLHFAKELESIV